MDKQETWLYLSFNRRGRVCCYSSQLFEHNMDQAINVKYEGGNQGTCGYLLW